jgi:TRAP-type mannitol/chloroaromatic compound transport system substrate-binding protein
MRLQRNLGVTFSIIVSILLIANFCEAKTINWKVHGFWSAGTMAHKRFEKFCQDIKILTDGRLEMKPYSGGAIVPIGEMFDATRRNVVQAMYAMPGWWTGKNPALSPISDLIAAGYTAHEAMGWQYNFGGMDMLNKIYDKFGLETIGIIVAPVESLVMKKPIYKIEDFKGMKFRSPEGMEGDFFRKLGAGVVVLPGGEVYSALDKGVVDGADWSSPALNMASGLEQTAKYFFYPGWHSLPQNEFTVNKEAWNELPKDIQAIVRTAIREWAEDFIQLSKIADIEAVAEMKAKGNVPIALDEEELRKLREVAVSVWDEWAQKSPLCKEAVQKQKEYLKMLGKL